MSEYDAKTCKCGAKYSVTWTNYIMRDRDSFECLKCDKKLESWNASTVPSFTLIDEEGTSN